MIDSAATYAKLGRVLTRMFSRNWYFLHYRSTKKDKDEISAKENKLI